MSNLDKIKSKKFQETLISIGLILVLVYEGVSVMMFLSTGSTEYFGILGLPSTMVCIIVLPLLGLLWKVARGGKIVIPTNSGFPRPRQQSMEPQQPIQGTWMCSCGYLAQGSVCRNCGRNKQ